MSTEQDPPPDYRQTPPVESPVGSSPLSRLLDRLGLICWIAFLVALVLIVLALPYATIAIIEQIILYVRHKHHMWEVSVLSERQNAVVEVFNISWRGYMDHAFPQDELLPLSDTAGNSRNGWGASAVDALSTAIILEQTEVVNTIVEHISEIDWSGSYENSFVNVFETTIRYMGGLLSAHDLINGPYVHLYPDIMTRSAVSNTLLSQASYLANNISFAFETPSGLPVNKIFVHNRTREDVNSTALAPAGSLVLEWTRLADLTGNASYFDLVYKAHRYLLDPLPKSSEPWPGLVGTKIDLTTGQFLDNVGGWGGWTDSFYEHLIKMYVYDPNRFGHYKDRWILAAESTMEHLASHPIDRGWVTFLAGYNGTRQVTSSGHLACFAGGNFILGGLVLDEWRYIDFGLSLVDGCRYTSTQTKTGLVPESFVWNVPDVLALDEHKQEFYNDSGFSIHNSRYVLRPEMLESLYYAYVATGDWKYRDWSWEAFKAITKATRAGSGYAEIMDVNGEEHRHGDFMESYWFAETLKYSYLIHATDAKCHVQKGKEQLYVFSTEGHPIRVVNQTRE